MKHGSLFSGIGGFDLAAEWMGWENVFHCEWNPFGQKILKHYWPKAESFNDITKSDFTKYANTIDILTGGFPCQPYSSAGKRLGKEDERHLWPEMLRAIQEISPRFVVGENVRGLLNWNGGMVFEEVCAELESYGYQVAPVVIPACAVNAPHRRERIWFVATNTKHLRCEQCQQQGQSRCGKGVSKGLCDNGNATNTHGRTTRPSRTSGSVESNKSNGHLFTEQWRESPEFNNRLHEFSWDAANTTGTGRRKDNRERKSRFNDQKSSPNDWDNVPTQSPVCGGDDGLPTELDGIAFSKWRNESIKGYGNAIVPQVAFQIFKAIQQCDESML
jgi:DNA (cytosine-5)-methyltransferase 1